MVAPTSVKRGRSRRIERAAGPLAEHDVELEVLHRRVEHLLDGAGEAVDLVDEEDVALVELGEDRGEVAGALERRARRDVQAHAHLGGDDAGEGGLAQPGRAGEEQVVGGLAPPARRLEDDRAGAPSARRWPTNSSSGAGPQAGLVGDIAIGIGGVVVAGHRLGRRSSSRTELPRRHGQALEGLLEQQRRVAVVGQVGEAVGTSSGP